MPVVQVKHVSHIALKTPHLEQQAAFYSDMVGLGATERDSAGRVYLRCNANHHAVVLIPADTAGMDHYALDVGGPAEIEQAAAALHKAGIETVHAEVAMVPKNLIKLEGKTADAMLRLSDALEEHDDVQSVYSNFDVDEKTLEALAH